MTPGHFILIILILASAGFLAWGIWFLATRKKREAKRITEFLSLWESDAKEAIERYHSLQNTERFFSDLDREGYLKKYSVLKGMVLSLKEPKEQDQIQRLSTLREFIKCYQSIGTAQIDNNVIYFGNKMASLPKDYTAIHSLDHYVGHHEVVEFKNRWRELLTQFHSLKHPELYHSFDGYDIAVEVCKLLFPQENKLQIQRNSDNDKFVKQELAELQIFFDTIFKYPLDAQQREAVVTLEDNTLVVSSAGSGKTSTIVGKVRYLVNQRHVAPEDILVVTYTRKAAAELRERMGIEGITSSTFHKHAMDTIGLLTGKKPTIAEPTVMSNIFTQLLEHDPEFLQSFNKYVTEMVNLTKDDEEYPSAAAKAADMQKYGHRSPYKDMNGNFMYLKSKQELQISVILTHLGVDFCYEEKYPFDTATEKNRQYKPDFTIHYRIQRIDNEGRPYYVNKVLYYEHFGIDKNGQVPKWFGDGMAGGWAEAQERYSKGIEWKTATHSLNGTDLIVTTSADFQREPDMASHIEGLLRQHGVPINPLTEEQKRQKLQEANTRVDETLYRLVSGFITLMKANGKTIDGLVAGISRMDEHAERNKFVLEKIIAPVYLRYQNALRDDESYDFTDVLLQAADMCNARNPYNYRYILVDEFQDISMDKYMYLKSLRKENPYTCLFCVGDDWQSIYRFSGSDMTLFYDFEKHFGYTKECKIETTHRFGQPLLNASSVFILTNPEQKVKKVDTTSKSTTKIKFIPYSIGGDKRKDVESIIKNIPADESIYILGRYSFNADSIGIVLPKGKEESKEGNVVNIAGRKVRYLTVHSSKGLEADHVIILDCDSGTYGFPSLIADDPVLEYVLSGADSFSNAEERRVFYVAITRARKGTYCLFDGKNPSPFMNEFGEFSKYENSTEAICPRCHRGFVRVLKSGKSKYGNPYINVNCTNGNCDYFETLFGENVYKYQPREAIKSWMLPSFHNVFKNTHHKLDFSHRIYFLIDKSQSPNVCLPMAIAPNMGSNDLLWERLKNSQEEFRVDAFKYYDQIVFFLMKPGTSLYISNAEMENAVQQINSVMSGSGYRMADANTILPPLSAQ